jgi:hypothetical protein
MPAHPLDFMPRVQPAWHRISRVFDRLERGKVTPLMLPGTPPLAMPGLSMAATRRLPPAGSDRTRRVSS